MPSALPRTYVGLRMSERVRVCACLVVCDNEKCQQRRRRENKNTPADRGDVSSGKQKGGKKKKTPAHTERDKKKARNTDFRSSRA